MNHQAKSSKTSFQAFLGEYIQVYLWISEIFISYGFYGPKWRKYLVLKALKTMKSKNFSNPLTESVDILPRKQL